MRRNIENWLQLRNYQEREQWKRNRIVYIFVNLLSSEQKKHYLKKMENLSFSKDLQHYIYLLEDKMARDFYLQ